MRIRERLDRLRLLATFDAALGLAIMVGWAVVATIGAPFPLLLMAIAVSVGLHLAAIDSGRFLVLGTATTWLLFLVFYSTRTVFAGIDALALTLAGLTVLAHNELVRVGYARRRQAQVDERVYIGSAVGLALVGLISVIGIGIAEPVAEADVQRSWLWMPAAAVVIALLALAFTTLPARRAVKADKRRWQPGERLPPLRTDGDDPPTGGF